jgi:hypothetical protein
MVQGFHMGEISFQMLMSFSVESLSNAECAWVRLGAPGCAVGGVLGRVDSGRGRL